MIGGGRRFMGYMAGVLVPASAMAQDKPPAKPAIEQVVVTAQRRYQKPQDVPISLTALGGRQLQNRQIRNASDIAAAIPNVQFSDPGSGEPPPVAIRGISTYTNQAGSDQAAAVYVDDIYVGGNNALSQLNLYDVDHLEVLRGPQGTLFGRNALAGAISIATRPPSATPSGELRVSVGNFDYRRLTGLFNVPIVGDRLVLNGAITGAKRSGYLDDPVTKSSVNALNEAGWRFKLQARPTEALTLTAIYQHSLNDQVSGGSPVAFYNPAYATPPYTGNPFPGFLAPFFATDPRILSAIGPNPNPLALKTYENPAPFLHYLEDTGGLRGVWNTDWGTFTSVTAYRHSTFNWTFSGGGTPLSLNSITDANRYEAWSQELRWNRQVSDWLDLVGGFFYFNERSVNTPSVTVGPGYVQLFDNAVTRVQDAFGPVIADIVRNAFPAGPGPVRTTAAVGTESYAGFVHGILHLAPTWDLTLGLRYTNESRDLKFSQQSTNFLASAAGFPTVGPTTSSYSTDNLSPLATISWRPAPGALAYATVSQGFKAGGFQNYRATGSSSEAGAAAARKPFKAETITNYEIGAKFDLLGGRLRLDADGFYMDWRNRQYTFNQTVFGGSNIVVVNCCDVRVLGAEIDAAYSPVDGLVLRANYGTQYPEVTRAKFTTLFREGDVLDIAPRYTFDIGADLIVPVTERYRATLTADYAFRGHFNINQSPRVEQGAFGQFDARAALSPDSNRWTLGIWGKNLTDKRWITTGIGAGYGFPFLGVFNVQPALPRTFGADFSVRF